MENKNNDTQDIQEILICACKTTNHLIIFNGFSPENMVEVSFQLDANGNLFSRLWKKIKYLFGGSKTRYGIWETTILDDSHIPQLEAIVEFLKRGKNQK